jgi:hypothetical protein
MMNINQETVLGVFAVRVFYFLRTNRTVSDTDKFRVQHVGYQQTAQRWFGNTVGSANRVTRVWPP